MKKKISLLLILVFLFVGVGCINSFYRIYADDVNFFSMDFSSFFAGFVAAKENINENFLFS